MRYRVAIKQFKNPGHLILHLNDGRVIRMEPGSYPGHLKTGDTGRMVQGRKQIHFKPDAIDLDYIPV